CATWDDSLSGYIF
nr:immunoglobulin light chain junction region [Macaca mulatta]MPN85206.1 immunoglobulin light chain junction region [Macaca mulatta]MPN85253.1 immunoglobulin light chain junction region [Macaca mulatta]MPN85254.1 immunoglobulin light chain junction region [Macaca mulatta]MPN85289.1 immunoglobulin light chain junction region [Macaca mulatta]